ncbi:hypothetical protein, partial [Angelakisella massiliensis]|uniref:hypothetical protein n=1 Tax=Angelakisella massiliensis TaxID=1871018 RepID=UPI0023A81F65
KVHRIDKKREIHFLRFSTFCVFLSFTYYMKLSVSRQGINPLKISHLSSKNNLSVPSKTHLFLRIKNRKIAKKSTYTKAELSVHFSVSGFLYKDQNKFIFSAARCIISDFGISEKIRRTAALPERPDWPPSGCGWL